MGRARWVALKADIWEGLVRRHALNAALKQEKQSCAQGQVDASRAPSQTPQSLLQQDLNQTHLKNQQHLAPPGPGKRPVSKLKLFFLFLLFLLAGFLFFVGGFLTCYTLYPPAPIFAAQDVANPQSPAPEASASRGASLNSSNSYARRQLIGRGQGAGTLADQTQRQAARIANNQARMAASQAVGRVAQGIQSALGPYVGSFVSPLVSGVGNTTINSTLPASGQPLWSSQGGAQKGAPAGAQAQPQVQVPQASLNRFTLVVQEYSMSQDALAASDTLRAQGFEGYVMEEQRGKGDVVYVVKAGQFASYQEARQAAALLGRLWQRPIRVAVADQNNE
ncbi:MAG: hypothetical protein C0514_00900 [Candidatus Puniceispirillum sp.]|nr:hypothetical protein [Candidatus Puniceispirillum sp.]